MAEEEIAKPQTTGYAQANGGEHTNPETLFDALNHSYSDAYEGNYAQVLYVHKLISMLSPGSRVLDIGSGTGRPTASMLTEAGMEVIGVDISSAMVDAARANVPSATFHQCDMRQYRPIDSQKFDAVVSIFSMIILPTSGIKEMAFKMAHWLKPGGLLVLGTIDFTDVPQAETYAADPYHEWLNHYFMGQVIKDNVFGVGQWISLLRSADIALVDGEGSVFAAEESGIVMEPECFIIGHKGDKDALIGPFPFSSYQIEQERLQSLAHVERRVVRDKGFLQTYQIDSTAEQKAFVWNFSNETLNPLSFKSEVLCDCRPGNRSFHGAGSFSSQPSWLSQLSPALERIDVVVPAPFNDTISIINDVATFFNLQPYHFGTLLQDAATHLRRLGFTEQKTHLIGEENLDFASSTDRTRDGAELLSLAFIENDVSRSYLEAALRAQLVRYFESQKHLGGNPMRVGYQRIALEARKTSG